jgi:hypothetical protein
MPGKKAGELHATALLFQHPICNFALPYKYSLVRLNVADRADNP